MIEAVPGECRFGTIAKSMATINISELQRIHVGSASGLETAASGLETAALAARPTRTTGGKTVTAPLFIHHFKRPVPSSASFRWTDGSETEVGDRKIRFLGMARGRAVAFAVIVRTQE